MPSGFSSSLQYVALNRRVPQKAVAIALVSCIGKLHWAGSKSACLDKQKCSQVNVQVNVWAQNQAFVLCGFQAAQLSQAIALNVTGL